MKRGFIELVFVFFFVLVLQISIVSASLGISPAKQEITFQPGMQLEYTFKVFADEGKTIQLYSAGAFAELVEFDKKEIVGSGSFTVKIKLPEKIEIPGKHRMLIGAREYLGNVGGVGTAVAVQAPIDIFVPYPGKYAEIDFQLNNVNYGEMINFKVDVASKGKEAIFATTSIEIYSNEEKIDTHLLGSRQIESQARDIFEKSVNSSEYKPGDYEAIAAVDYQEKIAKTSLGFRIGYLFVNITNYTTEIMKKGIQPFEINIESLWNNPIKNVYGEIEVNKDGNKLSSFITPSIDLSDWEKKSLIGYLDTENLDIGKYDLNIKINYGEDSTLVGGKLKIKKERDIKIYIVTITIVIVIAALAFFYLKKRNKGKKKR